MSKSWEEMNITELKAEKERVSNLIKKTENVKQKNQYITYMFKIAKEIKYYEKHFGK